MHIHTSDLDTLSLGFGGYTCNWGVHMCGLYETDAEHDDLVYSFLHQGDVDGDLVRYYHSDPTPERFKREYARRYPNEADHPNDPERFTLLTAEQRCYPNGRFDPLSQDPKLRAVRDAARKGGRHIRGIGEMDWVSRDVPGRELLLPYEARLNALFEGTPMLIACIYDLRKCSGATIMGVLRTHRFTISHGMIVENPYYDPDGIVRRHAPHWPPIC
jgi:hypothetical protein